MSKVNYSNKMLSCIICDRINFEMCITKIQNQEKELLELRNQLGPVTSTDLVFDEDQNKLTNQYVSPEKRKK